MKGKNMTENVIIIDGATGETTEETVTTPRSTRVKVIMKKARKNLPVIAVVTATAVTALGIFAIRMMDKTEGPAVTDELIETPEAPIVDDVTEG